MVWLCILASFLWGSNIVFMKSLLASQPPLTVALWRVLFSAGVLFILGKGKKISFHVEGKTVLSLIVLGLFNVALNFSFSFMGMARISGTYIALINALSPVVVLLLSFFFCRKKPDKKGLIAAVLTVFGIGCSFGFRFSVLNIGHLLLVLSLAFYSGSFFLAQKIEVHPIVKSFYAMLFGGMLLGVWCSVNEQLQFLEMSVIQWQLFLVISVCGFAVIQWIYFTACEKLGVKQVSFLMNLNPVFTYLGSVLFLSEKLMFEQLIGMGFVLLGLLISKPKKEL